MSEQHSEDQWSPPWHERERAWQRWFWFTLLTLPVLAWFLAFVVFVLLSFLGQFTGR